MIDVRLAPGSAEQGQPPAAVRLPSRLTMHIGAARAVVKVRMLGSRFARLTLDHPLPLHVGAGPRALLAWESREEWDAYVARRPLEPLTERTPTTREELFAELERCLELGYAVSDEDVTPGIASLGTPVFDYTGHIRAAISIGGMRQFLLEEICDEAVQLLHLPGPLRGLPLSELPGHELRRVPGDNLGQATCAAARVSLTGRRRTHQQQVDIALSITIAPRRRAEDAPVDRLGVPAAERAPQALP